MEFKLSSQYEPSGDQPKAIAKIIEKINSKPKSSATLKGVTGSGKTFTMANIITQLGRPTLVLSHNKTLAAQLYEEFKNFFPNNAVEFFVSYYDYYQPESYIPAQDKYIEKDLAINEEIEKMRLSTTTTLLSGRRDVIVVSSVSCIFGLGNPEDFEANSINLKVGDRITHKKLMYSLVEAIYTRTERELTPATFRVSGENIDIMTAYGGACYRVMLYDDEIEEIQSIDPNSGMRISSVNEVKITPANIFVTTKERISTAIGEIYVDMGKQVEEFERNGRMVEAQRLKQRVEYDLEMIKELGYCSGIENYSRYFDRRSPGQAPFCLLNYFPEDMFTIIDESHAMVPQIRGMYGGDRARKDNLIEYGFRLEAARDNRPLTLEEFNNIKGSTLYVSATPTEYEIKESDKEFVEQIIRPTGLVDPPISLRTDEGLIDNILEEIDDEVKRGNKVLVITTTKVSSENLSNHFDRMGIRNRYIHSEIETLERVAILRDLRDDLYDVLVGVNLLREGLDLPNVGLVIILDGDSVGFMRNKRSLIQIAGRAARHPQGRVIIYTKTVSKSIRETVEEVSRNRIIQIAHNRKLKQFPSAAIKSGDSGASPFGSDDKASSKIASNNNVAYPLYEQHYRQVADTTATYEATPPQKSIDEMIDDAKRAMESSAKALKFNDATKFRELMYELIAQRDKLNKGSKR